jgi:hypothetical protein
LIHSQAQKASASYSFTIVVNAIKHGLQILDDEHGSRLTAYEKGQRRLDGASPQDKFTACNRIGRFHDPKKAIPSINIETRSS